MMTTVKYILLDFWVDWKDQMLFTPGHAFNKRLHLFSVELPLVLYRATLLIISESPNHLNPFLIPLLTVIVFAQSVESANHATREHGEKRTVAWWSGNFETQEQTFLYGGSVEIFTRFSPLIVVCEAIATFRPFSEAAPQASDFAGGINAAPR